MKTVNLDWPLFIPINTLFVIFGIWTFLVCLPVILPKNLLTPDPILLIPLVIIPVFGIFGTSLLVFVNGFLLIAPSSAFVTPAKTDPKFPKPGSLILFKTPVPVPKNCKYS